MIRPVILPYDGKSDFNDFLGAFLKDFSGSVLKEMVSFIKLNDANYYPDSSAINTHRFIRTLIARMLPGAKIFLDLKLADTNGTDVNTLKHFAKAGVAPDILTVRESVGAKGFLLLRLLLPNTKLAIVSALTDIPADELQRRNGTQPAIKIISDISNLEAEYAAIREESDPERAIDMVVCSPLELKKLIEWFPVQYQYIVPGIRDHWMTKGQQARVLGVKEALDMGATYVVMGSQLTKGNPERDISPEESQEKTAVRIKAANYSFLCANDPIQMLYHCGGFYESPKDADGKYIGPLVTYAGRDETGKNKVGFTYFNFAKAEQNPIILRAFAHLLAKEIEEGLGCPDVVVGMPMGGHALATLVSGFLGCRLAKAEKKITKLAKKKGEKDKSELILSRHDILPGDLAIILEDCCNNFSTTDKAIRLVESFDAHVTAIAAAINRSDMVVYDKKYPVFSVYYNPSPQHLQIDAEVKDLIKAGKIVREPKHQWSELMDAMAV